MNELLVVLNKALALWENQIEIERQKLELAMMQQARIREEWEEKKVYYQQERNKSKSGKVVSQAKKIA